jgi:hypothetical protein
VEYVAMSETDKEIRFIDFILNDIGIEVELPIVVKTDNASALFMSQNSTTGVRSRHVNTRYHFIRENVEDRIALVEFVKSSGNDSDIFMRNINQEIYKKHAMKFLRSIEYLVVDARFGPGRVLKILLSFIQKLVFICLGYPLGIFIIDEMCESES